MRSRLLVLQRISAKPMRLLRRRIIFDLFLLFLILLLFLCCYQTLHNGHDFLSSNSLMRVWRILRRKETVTFVGKGRSSALFPNHEKPLDDRILLQIDYANLLAHDLLAKPLSEQPMKTILLTKGFEKYLVGRQPFLDGNCPVNLCEFSQDMKLSKRADAVVFKLVPEPPEFRRPKDQVWVLYLLESPFNTRIFEGVENQINWTASYRPDSTIVTPYEKYVPDPTTVNSDWLWDGRGKVERIAWFVSNCRTPNHRLQYALQLNKYYPVDIFGECGSYHCPKSEPEKCTELMRRYKYYLSFENSNCRHYITEKFFTHGLRNGLVPIVMGAPRKDYERVSPPSSFIHVDDFDSPQKLGEYLHHLDRNPQEYGKYLQWKQGGGFLIDTLFWCRLCAMLHDLKSMPTTYYRDVNEWFQGGETCVRSSWKD